MTVAISIGSGIREISMFWVDQQTNRAEKKFNWSPSVSANSDTALAAFLDGLDQLSGAALRTVNENVKSIAAGQKGAAINSPNSPISVVYELIFVSDAPNAAGNLVEVNIPIYCPVASALINATGELNPAATGLTALVAAAQANLEYRDGTYTGGQPNFVNGMTYSPTRSAEVTFARITSH